MPAPPKAGESEKDFKNRCFSHYKKEGDKPQKQRVAICLDMWRRRDEDITYKINQILGDESGATTTGDVATNVARGHVDVIGAGCPKGYTWSKEKKVCVKRANEAHVWVEKGGKKKQIPDHPEVKKKYKNKGWKIIGESWPLGPKKSKEKTVTMKHKTSGKEIVVTAKSVKDYEKRGYVKESTVIGGTYANANTNIAGSGQTRVVGARDGEITVLDRSPRPLRFNKIFGAYLPSIKGNDELEEAKKDMTPMECIECGKKFKKKIGPRTLEVKCPKCGSYDTEPT